MAAASVEEMAVAFGVVGCGNLVEMRLTIRAAARTHR
jgi:hypothetical protein